MATENMIDQNTVHDSSNNDSVFEDPPVSGTQVATSPCPVQLSVAEVTVKTTKQYTRVPILSEGCAVCRICHGSENSLPICGNGKHPEPLISPCHCSGTMGLYHRSCLEQWLSTSNTEQCEICNFQYVIQRQPKRFIEFLKHPGSRGDRRNLIGDLICWFILTPLAIASGFLCIHGAIYYATHNRESVEVPGLICLAVFLAVTYSVWLAVSLRYHYKVWKEWRSHNQVVKVLDISEVGQRSFCSGKSKSDTVSPEQRNDRNNNGPIVALQPPTPSSITPLPLSATNRVPVHASTPATSAETTVTIRFAYDRQTGLLTETVV